MINSEIFKYFRTLNDFISSGELLVDTFGNTDVFISVTTNTFYIFDLNKFDILFTGPYIPGITQYVFHKDILFISTGKSLEMYQRSSKIGFFDYKEEIKQVMCIGELVFTLHKNKIEYRKIMKDRSVGREDGSVGREEDDNSKDINKDNSKDNDVIPLSNTLLFIHHPMAYLNKILLISDSQTSLFNFIKKKEIYKFKCFKEGVCIVRNTKVVDLVGVGYTNGQIDILNLKKDEILFSFNLKKEIKDLDFSNEKMCVVGGGDLYLFDLIEKRLILKTKGLSGKFIGEEYLLISKGSEDNEGRGVLDRGVLEKDLLVRDVLEKDNTNTNISLFKIQNNSLNLIKVKNNLKNEILFLEEGSLDNTFVVGSKGEVFKYNTGNTLSYEKLKFKGKIEKMSFKGGEGVLYGDKILYKLGSSIKYILNSEIDLITNYKEIGVILVDNSLIILNLNTKMIYKKIPVNEPIKCIKMDRVNLYVMFKDGISVISYRGSDSGGNDGREDRGMVKGSMDGRGNDGSKDSIKDHSKNDTKDNNFINNNKSINNFYLDFTTLPNQSQLTFLNFKVFDSLIALSSNSTLFLFSNGILFRSFPGSFKDFTISPNLKWLGVCKEDFILIFDILTGTQIDSFPFKGKFIRFTLDMMFILIVSNDNKLILFNNKSNFSPLRRREEKTISKIKKEDFLKIKKRHQKLTGEILLVKTLNEIEEEEGGAYGDNLRELEKRKEDYGDNNQDDKNNNDYNLLDFTIFLNKILKEKKIKKEDAEKIGEKYEKIFKKFEENFIKSIGYLENEKGGM